MSLSSAEAPSAGRRPDTIRLNARAVAALTTELSRDAGPKSGLVLGLRAGSPVLKAALDALLPDDSITFVADEGAVDELRATVKDHGAWVADRVRVVDTLDAFDTADVPRNVDVVIIAAPLTGTAAETRALLRRLSGYLSGGGVLTAATLAGPALADGASDEMDRQSSFYGVGDDLVVRNRPPLRIHRLRFTAADVAVAERLRPAVRPSSVPLTRTMNIDSNGIAAAGIALGLAAAARLAGRRTGWWLVPALAAAPVAAFFRDPERVIPDDEAAIVAGSDGKVLSVERVVDARLGDDEFLRIAVFLSILDVHVNRAPVAGRVADYFVEDGGYAAAMSPAAEHNVAAYTVLDTVHGTVAVVQRTGLIARRIVQRAPVGSMLAKGERIGLIRFGSRTDVYLPAAAAEAEVAPGDKVLGGTTVIAHWR
jgi:phosphatidylserine decarboxylase